MQFSTETQTKIQVRPFHQSDRSHWENYVKSHPQSTVFHQLAWCDAVAEAYGHDLSHFTAWQEDRLVGILPLMVVNGFLTGKVLVSVPYGTYGGLLADSGQIEQIILDEAEKFRSIIQARYLELRHREPRGVSLPSFGNYVTFRKELPIHEDEVLQKYPKKARAATRNGLKMIGEDCSIFSSHMLRTIYGLYAWNMKKHGSPNYSLAFFEALQRHYGEDCVCLVIHDGVSPLGGVVSFIFRDEITPYFCGTTPTGDRCCVSNVMFLKLMQYAIKKGLRIFDFNRTRRDNSGPFNFKRHMGFEPVDLNYQVSLSVGEKIPNLSPSNKRYKMAIKVWKKLPLWITKPAGQRISKWIP